jgi:hypothetical protein
MRKREERACVRAARLGSPLRLMAFTAAASGMTPVPMAARRTPLASGTQAAM